MANIELHYDQLPLDDGEMDLSIDWRSCELFLAALLDYASAEHVERVTFSPAEADQCLRLVVGRDEYDMVPLPREAGTIYLKFLQQILLGRLSHFFLVRLSRRQFVRDNCGQVLVEVSGRRSKWIANCARGSINFVRVQ
jgi:hypothetical protein